MNRQVKRKVLLYLHKNITIQYIVIYIHTYGCKD